MGEEQAHSVVRIRDDRRGATAEHSTAGQFDLIRLTLGLSNQWLKVQ